MPHFTCIVHEGQPAHSQAESLEAALQALHDDHFPPEKASMTWRVVPPGQMFTEAKPSTTSIVAPSVDHPTPAEQRERFMRAICDLWTTSTGCTDHEVLVALSDANPSTSSGA